MSRRSTKATRAAAVKLYAGGMSGEAVGERLGVSAESVRTWVRAARGEIRPNHGSRGIALLGGRWVPDRHGVQRWVATS